MIGTQPQDCIERVIITAVAHRGLSVTVDGKPAQLAILADDGSVIAAGEAVAREAEAVALNSYRNFLQGKGHLVVHAQLQAAAGGPTGAQG